MIQLTEYKPEDQLCKGEKNCKYKNQSNKVSLKN